MGGHNSEKIYYWNWLQQENSMDEYQCLIEEIKTTDNYRLLWDFREYRTLDEQATLHLILLLFSSH